MIATLSGKVTDKLLDKIVIDVNGIGYGLLVPAETYNSLADGDETKLYVYEQVRENVYDLYGFSDRDTLNLFEQLVAVNGVGPKVALSVLSVGSVTKVRQAIASGDVRFIQSAPGVGKRVAERLIIELKDKVGLLSSLDEQSLLASGETLQQEEAVQALMSLGFTLNDAVSSLSGIDKNLPTNERVKLALRDK